AALHFQSHADRLPTAVVQRLGKLLEPAPRRADDVPRAALPQPVQRRLADHAAIQHPDALLAAVAGLHARDDFLDRGAVVPIAGDHLITQRITVARDHQAD